MRPGSRATLVLAVLLLAARHGNAARLPVRAFTIADGLARDDVARVRLDSRGFLWAATAEGLSRFDGIRFVTYGEADGLPSDDVSDIIEASDGSYWVATGRGVARHDPASPSGAPARGPFFEPMAVAPPFAGIPCRVLEDDRAGGVWVGAANGLFHLRRTGGGWATEAETLGPVAQSSDGQVNAIARDSRGRLWVATRGLGLLRRNAAGTWDRWTDEDGLQGRNVRDLRIDREGRVWIGCLGGLARFRADARAREKPELLLTLRDGFPNDDVRSLALADDGRVFVGLQPGFVEVRCDASGGACRVHRLEVESIRSSLTVMSLVLDGEQRLWIATAGGGILRLDPTGATSYGVDDGLVTTQIVALMETSRGVACVAATEAKDARVLQLFTGERWVPIRLNVPSPIGGWGSSQLAVEDREGRWWVPGGRGVWRFPSVSRLEDLARATPSLIATRREGLRNDEVFRLWEDSRGDIWISAYGLAVWDRASGRVRTFDGTPGIEFSTLPSAFAEDKAGHVWIGDYSRGLLRYDGASFEHFGAAEGVPAGVLSSLHVDARGSLWVGTSNGAATLDDPDASSKVFRRIGTEEGLSSREVSAIVEDRGGRIYFAGGRGIDRFDRRTRRFDRVAIDEGVNPGSFYLGLADRDGALWFAAPRGIIRFVPRLEAARKPPKVSIFGIRVAGEPRAVPALGTDSVHGLVLDATKRRLEVEFAAVDAGAGSRFVYEHRLEGGDDAWSSPSTTRSVELANLAPGRYRLAVRARTPNGAPGPEATVAFVVRPPVWRRADVFGATVAMLGLVIYWGHRRRLARALELERVRTRIATDLHDDLGSTLSQIAIVSEVIRRRLPGDASENAAPLQRVADNARDAVESLADIVWSVDPKLDRLSDLVHRMRRFAEEMAFGRGFTLRFAAPGPTEDRSVGADVRRAIFLALKESVNNAARHSDCRVLEVTFLFAARSAVLTVRDDGGGFDDSGASSGHGLASLRRRAAELGGLCEIRSGAGTGTTIRFEVPVDARLRNEPV